MTNKNRLTFGLFTEDSNNLYKKNIIQGVADAVAHLDCNLLVFTSHMEVENIDRTGVEIESIFESALKASLNGIIIFSEPVLYCTNPLYFEGLLKRIETIPHISLIHERPGLTSLGIIDKQGFYQVIEHLIKVHNRRRIAFICGWMQSFDAQVRLETYKEVLKDNNIPFDENLVTTGNFIYTGGVAAVKMLIEERHADFDAIASSNDHMAIGAIYELGHHGLRVPEDVAVVGFDNVPEAINSLTELTTVTQPAYSLGYRSVFLLEKMCKGVLVPERNYINTIPIIRKSCGCRGSTNPESDKPCDTGHEAAITRILLEKFAVFLPIEMEENYIPWAKELGCAFARSIAEKSADSFTKRFKELFTKKNVADHIPVWNDIFSDVFNYIKGIRMDGLVGFILEFNKIIQILLQEFSFKTDFAIENFRYKLNEFEFLNLHFEYTMPDLIRSLKKQFDFYSMNRFYLSILKDDHTFTCFYSAANNDSSTNSVDYPVEKLLPPGILPSDSRFSLIFGSIYYNLRYTGFMVTELGYINLDMYDYLTLRVSDIVKGIKFVEQINNYSQNLEKLVNQRTRELKNTQLELLKAAKQAGMSEVAIEVLHNVGNILNPMNVTCDLLKEKLISSLVLKMEKANTLLKSNQDNLPAFINKKPFGEALVTYYERIFEGFIEEQKYILSQLDEMQQRVYKINEIIQKQQQYTVFFNLKTEFNIIQCIENCLSILQTIIVQNRITVKKDFPFPVIKITSNESKLFYVLLELIKNSIEAVAEIDEADEKRIIQVFVEIQIDSVIIHISDSGAGIPSVNLSRIFSQYFTTKKGHIGIGLHTAAIFMKEIGGFVDVKNNEQPAGCDAVITLFIDKISSK